MSIVYCDFETKSACDLKTAGVYNYAQSLSTEVLCMAYAYDDGEVQMWTGGPLPDFMSALSYYDAYRTERLPANLLQAQRDYFGAHTYQRLDKPGKFHTHWPKGAQ